MEGSDGVQPLRVCFESEQPLALPARGNGKGRGHKAQFQSPLLSSDDVSRSPCFHRITEVFQAGVRCFHLDGSELASAHLQKEQHGHLRLL